MLKPKDMEGKSIVTSVGETGTSYLGTFAAQNGVDFDKIKQVQVDAQIRVNYFLQNKVDLVSVYRTNDLPSVEEKTGIKFPILDMAEYGLAIPGLAAVSSDAIIAKKGDALKRFLIAFDQGIDATRKDPAAASKALLKAWNNGPSLSVVEAQVKATVDAIQPEAGHPAGWMTAQQIKSSLDLLKTDEDIGTPKPAETFLHQRSVAGEERELKRRASPEKLGGRVPAASRSGYQANKLRRQRPVGRRQFVEDRKMIVTGQYP